jgi:hypothetical protein
MPKKRAALERTRSLSARDFLIELGFVTIFNANENRRMQHAHWPYYMYV